MATQYGRSTLAETPMGGVYKCSQGSCLVIDTLANQPYVIIISGTYANLRESLTG